MLGAAAAGGGVSHGDRLIEFAEAVLADSDEQLLRVRSALRGSLGDVALVDAAAVVGFFNAIDRVADATGIPLDPERLEGTADFRAELGIDRFVEGRL